MRISTHRVAATLFGVAAAVSTLAQNGPASSTTSSFGPPATGREGQLSEVVVTANRFPQKQAETGKVLTVLSDSVLRANSGRSLTALLSEQAGLTIVGSQQPLGAVQSVFLRGAASGYTLILLDGIPLYDPSNIEGNFDLNFLPIDQIERVEILKGGQSTLYGSDAVAGVINIITRQPDDRRTSGNALLSVGSYRTGRASVGLGGTVRNGPAGPTRWAVQYSGTRSRGFSAAYDSTGRNDFLPNGFGQNTLRATLSHGFSTRLRGNVVGLYSGYRANLDAGAFRDDPDYVARQYTRQLGAGFVYALPKGELLLNYQLNRSERSYLDDSTSRPLNYVRSRYGATSHFAEVYGRFRLAERLELVAGTDFRAQNTDQTYLSVSDFGPFEADPISARLARVNILSAWASVSARTAGGLGLEAGGRLNRHSVYGQNWTYTLNPFWNVAEWSGRVRLKLLVNVASSFKAPSLYYLYSPYGNLDLRPETSTNLDAGAQFSASANRYVRVVYFQRSIRDAVFFESLNVVPFGRYVNLTRQNASGVEVDAAYALGRVQLTANYTYVDGTQTVPKAGGADVTTYNLLRRPRHAANVVVSYQPTARLQFSTTLRSVGQRADRFFNETTFQSEDVTLRPYTTLNVYGSYKPTARLSFFADLQNLSNVQYFEVYGFASRRFNATVGAVATF